MKVLKELAGLLGLYRTEPWSYSDLHIFYSSGQGKNNLEDDFEVIRVDPCFGKSEGGSYFVFSR